VNIHLLLPPFFFARIKEFRGYFKGKYLLLSRKWKVCQSFFVIAKLPVREAYLLVIARLPVREAYRLVIASPPKAGVAISTLSVIASLPKGGVAISNYILPVIDPRN